MQSKTQYKTKIVLIWVLKAPLCDVVAIYEAHKKVYWSYKCMPRRVDDLLLLWAIFIPDIILYCAFFLVSPAIDIEEKRL